MNQAPPATPYPSDGTSVPVVETSAKPYNYNPQIHPKLVMGEKTDAERDTPMRDMTAPVSLPSGAPTLKPTNAPTFGDLPQNTPDKGKGKGIAREGEKYAGRHPNVERAWEKRTNIRKPGGREGIKESESLTHTTGLGTNRCKEYRNLHHKGMCWPMCEECGKRHRRNEC